MFFFESKEKLNFFAYLYNRQKFFIFLYVNHYDGRGI